VRRAAGVAVDLKIWPVVPHGVGQNFIPTVPRLAIRYAKPRSSW